MLFKKKIHPQKPKNVAAKTNSGENRPSAPVETSPNSSIQKVSNREIAMSYMLW